MIDAGMGLDVLTQAAVIVIGACVGAVVIAVLLAAVLGR